MVNGRHASIRPPFGGLLILRRAAYAAAQDEVSLFINKLLILSSE
jgi:hypothetical protein